MTNDRPNPRPEDAANALEMMQEILGRSATEPAFRAQLLANPREAVSAHTGTDIPEQWNVAFIENEADLTLVLPDPVDPSAELSESELEAVAGGLTWIPFTLATIALYTYVTDEFEQDGNVCRA